MTKEQYEFVRFLENSTQAPTLQENGDLYCWIAFDELSELTRLVGHDFFCEGGLDVNLQGDCVCIVINDLLEHMDIDKEVFKHE